MRSSLYSTGGRGRRGGGVVLKDWLQGDVCLDLPCSKLSVLRVIRLLQNMMLSGPETLTTSRSWVGLSTLNTLEPDLILHPWVTTNKQLVQKNHRLEKGHLRRLVWFQSSRYPKSLLEKSEHFHVRVRVGMSCHNKCYWCQRNGLCQCAMQGCTNIMCVHVLNDWSVGGSTHSHAHWLLFVSVQLPTALLPLALH